MNVYITLTNKRITATPSGYDKNVKAAFSSFGGAQKPWKWNGVSWEIVGESAVSYWADKVKTMFSAWKVNPSTFVDNR